MLKNQRRAWAYETQVLMFCGIFLLLPRVLTVLFWLSAFEMVTPGFRGEQGYLLPQSTPGQTPENGRVMIGRGLVRRSWTHVTEPAANVRFSACVSSGPGCS